MAFPVDHLARNLKQNCIFYFKCCNMDITRTKLDIYWWWFTKITVWFGQFEVIYNKITLVWSKFKDVSWGVWHGFDPKVTQIHNYNQLFWFWQLEKDTLWSWKIYPISRYIYHFFLLKWYKHERYGPIDCQNLFIVSKFETFEIVASMSFRGTKNAKVLKKSLQIWWYHQKLKTKKIISPTNIQMKTNLKHKLIVSPHPNLKRGKNCGSAQKFNKSQQICSYHQG